MSSLLAATASGSSKQANKGTCPTQTPNIQRTKSHVPFSLLASHQSYQCRSEAYSLFRSTIRYYGEELLAPRPTPNLEDYTLSAVRDYLFNIFAITVHIGDRSSIRNVCQSGKESNSHDFRYASTSISVFDCILLDA